MAEVDSDFPPPPDLLPTLSRQNSSQRAAQAPPIWDISAPTDKRPEVALTSIAEKEADLSKPPPMPPFLKKQTTVERARQCDEIWDDYITAIEDVDGQFQSMENLRELSSFKDEASKPDAPEMGVVGMKRLMREVQRELPRDLEVGSRAAMFVRFDEDEPRFLRAALVGVEGTPYANGVFLFDIFIPHDYPSTNCKVRHITPGGEQVYGDHTPGGFSPNLHRDSGKVCLSLLGTWDGPGWDPESSNIYQVLSSILWMILGAEHPYYMEPGHGGWEGTAPTEGFEPEAIEYEEEVRYATAKFAILDTLRKPPVGFEDTVREHFRLKRRLILATVQSWAEKGSKNLRSRLAPVLEEIHEEFSMRLTVAEAEEEVARAEAEVAFVREKLAFLHQKLDSAGPGGEARFPKARRRLRLGPGRLAAAAAALARAQALLDAAHSREEEGNNEEKKKS